MGNTGIGPEWQGVIGLADLKGRWHLERSIIDARAGLTGRLEGESCWSPDGDGLRQVETGTLQYGEAAPMPATRAYLWREAAVGLAVFFAHGAPFHTITWNGSQVVNATHFCEPDTYVVRYEFSKWPHWESRWQVTGPRKSATILNRFRPMTRLAHLD